MARTKHACAAAAEFSAVPEERVRPKPFQHCLFRGSTRRPAWGGKGMGEDEGEREIRREKEKERERKGRRAEG